MSQLSIYSTENNRALIAQMTDPQQIGSSLAEHGIRFERWQPAAVVKPGDDNDTIMAAFAEQIAQLKQTDGYQTADVISLDSSHPDKAAMRQKFLSEHTHSEDEVRFFVAGQGMFCLHLGEQVYQLLCQQNDLISVPAGTKHWFDMGSEPNFVAIRLFIDPQGWIANSTGDDIANHFPLLD